MLNPADLTLACLANFPAEYNFGAYKAAQFIPVRNPMDSKIICHHCGVEGHKSTYC
jgi:hypothetical protein